MFKFKPWLSVVTATVIYSDGFTRTVAAIPEEDGVDEMCSEGVIGPILDEAAQAYWMSHVKGERYHRGLGRGEAYPCLVKVAWVEAALFDEPGTQPWVRPGEEYESRHRGEARVVRTYDVSGYAFMDELERLLSEWS